MFKNTAIIKKKPKNSKQNDCEHFTFILLLMYLLVLG